MKFFIDTANLEQITSSELRISDGVTTNPSLMAKEGITGDSNIISHYKYEKLTEMYPLKLSLLNLTVWLKRVIVYLK